MKITKPTNNGNITTSTKSSALPYRRSIKNWTSTINSTGSAHLQENSNNVQFNPNTIYCLKKNTDSYDLNNVSNTGTENFDATSLNVELVVCNRQYCINAQSIILPHYNRNKETENLEAITDICVPSDNSLESPNAYSDTTLLDEERAFDHSDTDEMSENCVLAGPRGIVNPNYPGFQHLAHTLQDYSSNIENFYQSENEMTDDDADVEITELTFESECNQFEASVEYKNIKNNNINCAVFDTQEFYTQNCPEDNKVNESNKNRIVIPDLLKTVSRYDNNNVDEYYDLNCTEADIENNFNTKEIIGNFNKEVEDEIRHLLNYNINIQDDLEELRKDIKESFAKPIEKTINNISEVVNDVIKKLVQTHSEACERNAENYQCTDSYQRLNNKEDVDEIIKINKENEKNIRTEMNLSRPTFLLIENSTNSKITDAFLSDGKDEINITEYDTDKLSLNVENTIKQLSTELRKIIPKLDQMRERDRLWAEGKKDTMPFLRDSNCNEIERSSKYYKDCAQNSGNKRNITYYDVKSRHVKSQTESRGIDDQQETKTCYSNAQSKSVLMNNIENTKDTDLESFDVYNIETALPKLDFDAIENHLKAAKEAERRKRNDREEIRRRLAMGADGDEYYSMGYTDRPGKKPSLHSRLQSGMNLQICFMNETASDNESQDVDKNVNCNLKSFSHSSIFGKTSSNHPYQTRPLSVNITKHDKISTAQTGAKLRPSSLMQKSSRSHSTHSLGHIELKESDFYALQATLQTEARIALAQAKEMARIQMECERRSRPVSPVTEMLRRSMEKANIPLAPDRRRVSRQLLTDMNIAQLQVIVNELHSQIESLNDSLVKLLMARDELHMGQDSMLVDIEDLTRYLGVKEQTKKTKGSKSGMKRLTSLVHK